MVLVFDEIDRGIKDCIETFEIILELEELSNIEELQEDLKTLDKEIAKLEFRRMFHGEQDHTNAF